MSRVTMLATYLREAEARRLRYGRHDCVLFAGRWVLRATGRDLMLGIRYRSLRDGLAQLRAIGFDSPVDVAAAYLPEIARLCARLGDIAVMGDAMGIVCGDRIAFLGRGGLQYRPLTLADRVFGID